jgi:integrase
MLTNTKIKHLKPKDKLYRIADSNGLAIEVSAKGEKKWRFRYRFNKKASMVSLGKYPSVLLAQARILRDEHQLLLSQGINPSYYNKKVKTERQKDITFKDAFDKWFDRHKSEWTQRTAKKQVSAFEKHIFPFLGSLPVKDIKTLDILEVLRVMDDKGISVTLKKVKGWSSRVFKDCVATGLIEYDPIANISNDNFRKHTASHYATVTATTDIKGLLLVLSRYQSRGSWQVAEALNLAPYLMLRPSELTNMKWKEVDFDNALIRITSERMKQKKEHLVPMSNQVLAKFKDLWKLSSYSEFVFPSPKKSNTHINSESLRAAINRLGVSRDTFTTHGFRSMASTRLNELNFNSDWVEAQLAHVDSNSVRRTYNNAEYLEQRVKMMQSWSNYLDELKNIHL